MLDSDTVACVDKFENFYINRIPPGSEDDASDDPGATKFKWEQGNFGGAASKLIKMNQFNLGEVATKVIKAKLSASGKEFILYSTIMGSIGAFIPFETRQDVDFFVHLQMNLSIESPSLCGRDFLSFRSMTDPIKNVIDGDLCE